MPIVHKLVILAEDAQRYLDLLSQATLPHLSITACTEVTPNNPALSTCDILFGQPDLIREALPYATNVKWAQSMWAGVTPLITDDIRQDYLLTGVKGVFGQIMSEYVFCHLLMHERKTLSRLRHQQAQIWDQTTHGTLRHKSIGIMGLGSIGSEVAKMAKVFNMKTRGYSRSQTQCEGIDRCFLPAQRLEFMQGLDYLVCLLPDTPDTTHLIETKSINALPNSAVIINAGRGNIIDHAALLQALKTDQIAAAVLDVFPIEPLPSEDPLWKAPNTIITSHTAAMSFPELVTPIFIENYQRYLTQKTLQYLINFEYGY
jgi:phosphoglycerate dehydrogenase-like enzyme